MKHQRIRIMAANGLRRCSVRRTMLFVFAFSSLAYLKWRFLFTFAPDAPFYSAIFFTGELVATLAGLVFFLHLAAPHQGTA
jgi:hypothetical protein